MLRTILLSAIFLATTSLANAQWEIQDSHTTVSLRGIHSIGNGVAWASGTEGTILRTTDEGATWQRCTTPPDADKLDFRGVQAFDQNTAIVMSSGRGDLSRLYKTTDACKTWKLVFTNPDKKGFWDAIQFSSRDNGVLLGDPVDNIFVVMLTFDGGSKWERQSLRATEDVNGEGIFAASNSSLLLSGYAGYRMFCTGGHGGPRLISLSAGPSNDTPLHDYVPTDAKLIWFRSLSAERFPVKTPQFDPSGCFSIASNRSSTTVAVGGNYQHPNDRDDTAWTDAFVNSSDPNQMFGFHLSKTLPHGYRSAVAYDATTNTWITVGPNGTDISRDDGKNWTALTPGKLDQPDADKNWNALSLPFVVGPKGRIGKLNAKTLAP
jgi:hypothetical protein